MRACRQFLYGRLYAVLDAERESWDPYRGIAFADSDQWQADDVGLTDGRRGLCSYFSPT